MQGRAAPGARPKKVTRIRRAATGLGVMECGATCQVCSVMCLDASCCGTMRVVALCCWALCHARFAQVWRSWFVPHSRMVVDTQGVRSVCIHACSRPRVTVACVVYAGWQARRNAYRQTGLPVCKRACRRTLPVLYVYVGLHDACSPLYPSISVVNPHS